MSQVLECFTLIVPLTAAPIIMWAVVKFRQADTHLTMLPSISICTDFYIKITKCNECNLLSRARDILKPRSCLALCSISRCCSFSAFFLNFISATFLAISENQKQKQLTHNKQTRQKVTTLNKPNVSGINLNQNL